jgi:hypothetical protein
MVQKRIDPTSSIARNLKERADQIAAQNRQGSQLVETIKTLQGNANLPQQLKTSVLDASKNRPAFSGLNVPNSVNAVIGQQNRPTIYNSSYNTSASQAINRFQTSLSGLNQYSPSHQGAGVIQRPLMQTQGTFGSGAFDRSQIANAPQSALFIQKQDRLATSTDKLTQAVEKLNTSLSSSARSRGGAAGAGGGDGGDGGGLGDTLENLGTKPRKGLRGGMAGLGLQTAGSLINSGIDAYLNYQSEMATAATDTYSNMARLSGFQQKRFLRNFQDYSAEALVLRSPGLASTAATSNLVGRIDKLATENKQAIDTAETQRELKDIAKTVIFDKGFNPKNLLEGFTSGGPKGAALSVLAGGLTSAADIAANAPGNNVLMRQSMTKDLFGGMMGDLYLKNRTAFDTQNLTEQISKMENAVLQNETVNINNLNKYLGSVNPRMGAIKSGRFFDVLEESAKGVTAPGYDQEGAMVRTAEQLRAPEKKEFANVLGRMGVTVGTEASESVMASLGAVGGAGAGGVKASDAASLERVRRMAVSGRGNEQQLLGQASLLGRISGGVSVEGNIKKLEEVLGRAVAIGMDNSELGQAFVQNVANVAAQMKTGDIDMVSKLVANMQKAGGGQLVDFERMQRSYGQVDEVRNKNVGVKTYTRENMAAFLDKVDIKDKDIALNILTEKFTTKDFQVLGDYAKKFSETGKIGKNAPKAVRDLLETVGREKAGLFTGQAIDDLRDSMISGLVMMTMKEFREKFGSAKNMSEKALQEFKKEYQRVQGGSGVDAEDVVKGTRSDLNLGGKASNDDAVKSADRKNASEQAQATANSAAAITGAVQAGKSFFQNISEGRLTTSQLQEYKSLKISEADTKLMEKHQELFTKSVDPNKYFQDKKVSDDERFQLTGLLSSLKKTEVLETELQKTPATTEQMAKGAVMSGEQAADIGTKFADAFFTRLQGSGGKVVLEVPAKRP